MKKFFTIILVAITLLAFTGCSKSKTSEWGNPQTFENSTTTFEDILFEEIITEEIIVEEIEVEEIEVEEVEVNSIEFVEAKLAEAQRNCNWEMIEYYTNKIVEIQNSNGFKCTVETIIHIGSVNNCTTTYKVVKCNKTVAEIKGSSFEEDFPYRKITVGNVQKAIQKSTGWSDDYLWDLNPLVTICGNSNNGYDFYLTIKI